MFALDSFVSSVILRARVERFWRLSSLFGTIAGAAGLAIALAVHFASLSPRLAGLVQVGVLLGGLLASVSVAWASARRLPPTSDILFRLDGRLGTEARISSLYTLRRSGTSGYFAERLSEAVAQESEGWRSAFRPSVRTLSLLAVAAALFVGIAVLALSDKPRRPSPVTGLQAVAAEVTDERDEPSNLPSEELPQAAREDAAQDWVRQALAELLAARADATSEETPNGFDVAAVERYTSELLDNMRESGARPLSAEELERLSDLASAAPLELADALDAILMETEPQEIQNQLDLISEYAARQSLLQGLLSNEEESDAETAADDRTPASSDASSASDVYPMSGFDDGRGEPPSLEEAPLPGQAGASGDVFEYVTGGVPIELRPAAGGSEEALRPVIDYERVQTILDARALPPGALETVRRYFELVGTEGET